MCVEVEHGKTRANKVRGKKKKKKTLGRDEKIKIKINRSGQVDCKITYSRKMKKHAHDSVSSAKQIKIG